MASTSSPNNNCRPRAYQEDFGYESLKNTNKTILSKVESIAKENFLTLFNEKIDLSNRVLTDSLESFGRYNPISAIYLKIFRSQDLDCVQICANVAETVFKEDYWKGFSDTMMDKAIENLEAMRKKFTKSGPQYNQLCNAYIDVAIKKINEHKISTHGRTGSKGTTNSVTKNKPNETRPNGTSSTKPRTTLNPANNGNSQISRSKTLTVPEKRVQHSTNVPEKRVQHSTNVPEKRVQHSTKPTAKTKQPRSRRQISTTVSRGGGLAAPQNVKALKDGTSKLIELKKPLQRTINTSTTNFLAQQARNGLKSTGNFTKN
jgi:hypothetical protein